MFEGMLQPMHLILVLAIVMIFFGPKKLPELGRGLGEAIRGFRDGMTPAEKTPAPPTTPTAPSAEETKRID